jgi:hypothetical protein
MIQKRSGDAPAAGRFEESTAPDDRADKKRSKMNAAKFGANQPRNSNINASNLTICEEEATTDFGGYNRGAWREYGGYRRHVSSAIKIDRIDHHHRKRRKLDS